MATALRLSDVPLKLPKTAFKNEPFTNFSDYENARQMRAAISRVRAELGREYDLVVGGQRVRTTEKIKSVNPARPSEVVAIHQSAGRDQVEPSIKAAEQAFKTWSTTAVEERVSVLVRAADIIRRRKFEFNAWLVLEVGKNWVEAEADTCETIDFLEYYAREAMRLAKSKPDVQLPGEIDEYFYIPLGVGAVISPWNFPFAIMAGMTSAAIVCGNTVVMKPSHDSPTIAAKFVEVLSEAGLPDGVVNFCPGSGSTFGAALVEHPRLRFIAFTGSKEVGLDINQRAAQPRQGQLWIKRTVLEMGGKDAIVVADDCDLDQTVEGVVASAFGFSGQKCSACSRAIVDQNIYDVFLGRLRDRVAQLSVGDPTENKNMGPVINEGSMKKILDYIEVGKKEGRIIAGGKRVEGNDGYFIQPTVVADVESRSRLGQEEIFGPVLAVIRAKDFQHALDIANDTEFGLTGAVYTSNPDRIAQAKREFHVGNLYINRKSTGAMVGAHPFGGFNMSGTDSKAGGPDYLMLFLQAKSIGEKITNATKSGAGL